MLGFDSYDDIAARLQAILAGDRPASHVPRDRRKLLPVTPIARQAAAAHVAIPGHRTSIRRDSDELPAGVAPGQRPACAPTSLRRRSDRAAEDRLGLRPALHVLRHPGVPGFVRLPPARRGRGRGAVAGRARASGSCSWSARTRRRTARISATCRRWRSCWSSWIGWTASTGCGSPTSSRPRCGRAWSRRWPAGEKVVPYFDLSFQHASGPVLRRMRRFGDADAFLTLIESIRAQAPTAGIRSNVICGFPGESEQDVEVLRQFLEAARLDAIGVFGYSDEDGTEAARLGDQVSVDEIEGRRASVADLAEELMAPASGGPDRRTRPSAGRSGWERSDGRDRALRASGTRGRRQHGAARRAVRRRRAGRRRRGRTRSAPICWPSRSRTEGRDDVALGHA